MPAKHNVTVRRDRYHCRDCGRRWIDLDLMYQQERPCDSLSQSELLTILLAVLMVAGIIVLVFTDLWRRA